LIPVLSPSVAAEIEVERQRTTNIVGERLREHAVGPNGALMEPGAIGEVAAAVDLDPIA
jgi:hypothetical protein